jgi:hypothetical protein
MSDIDYDQLAAANARRDVAQQQAAQELTERKTALDRALNERFGTVRAGLGIQIADDGHTARLRYGADDYQIISSAHGVFLRNTRIGGREWRCETDEQLLTGIAQLARPGATQTPPAVPTAPAAPASTAQAPAAPAKQRLRFQSDRDVEW